MYRRVFPSSFATRIIASSAAILNIETHVHYRGGDTTRDVIKNGKQVLAVRTWPRRRNGRNRIFPPNPGATARPMDAAGGPADQPIGGPETDVNAKFRRTRDGRDQREGAGGAPVASRRRRRRTERCSSSAMVARLRALSCPSAWSSSFGTYLV